MNKWTGVSEGNTLENKHLTISRDYTAEIWRFVNKTAYNLLLIKRQKVLYLYSSFVKFRLCIYLTFWIFIIKNKYMQMCVWTECFSSPLVGQRQRVPAVMMNGVLLVYTSLLWTLVGGAIHQKDVNHWVISPKGTFMLISQSIRGIQDFNGYYHHFI